MIGIYEGNYSSTGAGIGASCIKPMFSGLANHTAVVRNTSARVALSLPIIVGSILITKFNGASSLGSFGRSRGRTH